MDQHELKAACLELPGAQEEFPFGDEVSVFKVGGKMFALSSLDGQPLQLSVKCDPELAVQLRAAQPAITTAARCYSQPSQVVICSASRSPGQRCSCPRRRPP